MQKTLNLQEDLIEHSLACFEPFLKDDNDITNIYNNQESIVVPDQCIICRVKLKNIDLETLPSEISNFRILQCNRSSNHIFHASCFLKNKCNCPGCQKERQTAFTKLLKDFITQMASQENDMIDVNTKFVFLEHIDSLDQNHISNLIDRQYSSSYELNMLREKISDLGDFKNILHAINSHKNILDYLELTSDAFFDRIKANPSLHIPKETLEIIMTKNFLSNISDHQIMYLIEYIVQSTTKYSENTKCCIIEKLIKEISFRQEFTIETNDPIRIISGFITNDQHFLFKYLPYIFNRPLSITFYEMIDMALIYIQSKKIELESFIILFTFLNKNSKLSSSEYGELMEALVGDSDDPLTNLSVSKFELGFMINDQNKKLIDLKKHIMYPKQSTSLIIIESYSLLSTVDDARFSELLELFLSSWKPSIPLPAYWVFPEHRMKLKDDLRFISILIECNDPLKLQNVLLTITCRSYYDHEVFIHIFKLFIESHCKKYIFLLFNTTPNDILRLVSQSNHIEALMWRMNNIGYYWGVLIFQKYLDQKFNIFENHTQILDMFNSCYDDKICSDGKFYKLHCDIASDLYAKFLTELKYNTLLEFPYDHTAEYFKCLFRTRTSKFQVGLIIKEMMAVSIYKRKVPFKKIPDVFNVLVQDKNGLFYIRELLEATTCSISRFFIKLLILMAINDIHGSVRSPLENKKFCQIRRFFIEETKCLTGLSLDDLHSIYNECMQNNGYVDGKIGIHRFHKKLNSSENKIFIRLLRCYFVKQGNIDKFL